jgi:hypothetical protein
LDYGSEKHVQIQLALPPPHREHMRRLLRGDAPDDAFGGGAEPATANRPREERTESLAAAVAGTIAAAGKRLGWILAPLIARPLRTLRTAPSERSS